MPLVRVDVLETRTQEELAAIGNGVHDALVEAIGIPAQDRFQVLSRHAEDALIFDRHYLGIFRTPGIVLVQITMSSGRTVEQKKSLFAAIARNLAASAGVRQEDVFVNLVEVAKENWSFGNGIAQYAT
ncbi:MAG TPA: tautomerase family protein [Thermoanaerobaculia bacterium]|jgi:phenylpyruvate tautomerase PptA (4-oxalocrotonate tautomerase family)|nr:tautomerase family protein [Thermoanaerobaculia bacterium]